MTFHSPVRDNAREKKSVFTYLPCGERKEVKRLVLVSFSLSPQTYLKFDQKENGTICIFSTLSAELSVVSAHA